MPPARPLALALFVVLSLALVPVAAAEERAGSTVVVESGETVEGDLAAFGGTVLVEGTVTGNVTAVAGSVVVAGDGVVGGDLTVTAGSATIEGRVDGDTAVTAGALLVREGADLRGTLEVQAGSLRLDGRVDGDVRAAAESVTIGDSGVVGGSVTYAAEEFVNDGRVSGTVSRTDEVEFSGPITVETPTATLPRIPLWLSTAYVFVAHLVLGAILLVAFPGTTGEVTRTGLDRAVASGGVGLLTLVGGPVVLLLVAVTIVGIPLALVGALLLALLAWAGLVFGALTLGTWGASLAERDSPWLALFAGLLVVALSRFVPGGGLLRAVLTVLGVGALALVLWTRWRAEREDDGPGASEASAADANA
jgi:cytoskeletal protein CcmA (bactofilin family)